MLCVASESPPPAGRGGQGALNIMVFPLRMKLSNARQKLLGSRRGSNASSVSTATSEGSKSHSLSAQSDSAPATSHLANNNTTTTTTTTTNTNTTTTATPASHHHRAAASLPLSHRLCRVRPLSTASSPSADSASNTGQPSHNTITSTQQQHHHHHHHQQPSQPAAPSDPPRPRERSSETDRATESLTSAASKDLHSSTTTAVDHDHDHDHDHDQLIHRGLPELALEEATPDSLDPPPRNADKHLLLTHLDGSDRAPPLPSPDDLQSKTRPAALRRQSLVHSSNARVIKTLLDPNKAAAPKSDLVDYFSTGPPTLSANMLHRKIWVKRPGASATLVQIREDDLVDDVRDMILKKYANSLGRSYDSPDVTLRVVPKEPSARNTERTLGPEEDICRTLDAYFPAGQTVDDALVIDVPQRRTPKPSPRALPQHMAHYYDDNRPVENGTDYFPPMPVIGIPSPAAAPLTSVSHDSRQSHAAHERSMAVLTTGQVPPLPSPGASRRSHPHRPRVQRHATSSPTQLVHPTTVNLAASVHPAHLPPRPTGRPRLDSSASDSKHAAAPNVPPPPTPPAPEVIAPPKQSSTPPTPRVASPGPRKLKKKSKLDDKPKLPSGLLDGSVPPINVLIVEDNIINLKLLEAFMKRLKVRWQTAMNGRDAVVKWRAGGFHLVLMDIQLPIMSGLEATKEIRRLERVNNIGVFSSSSASSSAPTLTKDGEHEAGTREVKEEDKLGNGLLFKSPVIIVALTASSLQSDRHEALAAGCNDFLTKPVNFVWLERKVKEWGCMQALIDFDGWRKWKTFTDSEAAPDGAKAKTSAKSKKSLRASMSAQSPAPPAAQSPLPASLPPALPVGSLDGAVDEAVVDADAEGEVEVEVASS